MRSATVRWGTTLPCSYRRPASRGPDSSGHASASTLSMREPSSRCRLFDSESLVSGRRPLGTGARRSTVRDQMAVDPPPLPTPTKSRRIAAIASWITIVGAGVVLVLLLLSDPLTMVGAAASLAVAVAAAWNALTRRGAARLVSAALAVVAVVVCIVVLLAAHDLLALFASVGLAIAAVALGRYSLARDRASLISAPTPGLPVPAATKPVLIMNLKSGRREGRTVQAGRRVSRPRHRAGRAPTGRRPRAAGRGRRSNVERT